MESVIQSGEELLNRLIKLKEDDDLSRIWKLFSTNSNCYFYDTGTGKVVQMEQIVYELLEKFFAGKNETLIRSEELDRRDQKDKWKVWKEIIDNCA